jgi:hypothetical protein
MLEKNLCGALSPEGENGQQWVCRRAQDKHGKTLDDAHDAGGVYWSDDSALHFGLRESRQLKDKKESR